MKKNSTNLHFNWDSYPVILQNPKTHINPSSYEEARNNFLKLNENGTLFRGGTHDTINGVRKNITVIHSDGIGIPTYGYGFNLTAFNANQIEELIKHAFGGSFSNLQKKGIKIIADAGEESTRNLASCKFKDNYQLIK